MFEIAQNQVVALQEKFQMRENTEDESKFYDSTTLYESKRKCRQQKN